MAEAALTEQRDADGRESRPQPGDRPARGDHREHEWSEHLDRDGCAQRDAIDGEVEQPVHEREHEAEADHGHPRAAPDAAQLRPSDRQQDHRGEQHPQKHHAEGTHLRKEQHGDGCPDLLAHEPRHHECRVARVADRALTARQWSVRHDSTLPAAVTAPIRRHPLARPWCRSAVRRAVCAACRRAEPPRERRRGTGGRCATRSRRRSLFPHPR